MENYDDDDDIEIIVTLVSSGQIAGFQAESSEESDSGSRPRKRNKKRDFKAASERFDRMYFVDNLSLIHI